MDTIDRRDRSQIVIHEDDVGNSHGANEAMVELFARGAITSCSVMVPCPWFPEIARISALEAACEVAADERALAEEFAGAGLEQTGSETVRESPAAKPFADFRTIRIYRSTTPGP